MRDPRVYRQIVVYSGVLGVLVVVALGRGGDSRGGEAQAAVERHGARAAKSVTIAWGGDVTLGSAYGLPPEAGWDLLAPLARVLKGADVAAVNYEGTFGVGG